MILFRKTGANLALIALCCLVTGATEWLGAAEPLPGVEDGFSFPTSDWPWWRGPWRNGTAPADQDPPTQFGEEENILWRTPVPGRGHGSPTMVGDRIFLATADEDSGAQYLLCFDRHTGERRWMTTVHPHGGMAKNKRSTMASSTPACDGQHVFIAFPNNGAIIASALDLDGDIVWRRKVSDYVVHQGYGASPALYRHMVIVVADNKGGGALVAFDRTTGDVVWRRERPATPNYPTPTLVHAGGRDQLIMVGCDQIVSYNPSTGETLWETPGATTECVTSTLTDGTHVYSTGGYPKNHMAAVRADGNPETVWENGLRVYVPSLVIRDGYLYGVLDAGIAMCWKADTGKEMWKARLGGNYSASPVLVGDRIYACSEQGDVHIYRARPDRFEALSRNHLGDEVFATPTIVGGRIYHRVAYWNGPAVRREELICIAAP
ncbi:MAG: serine/threonine protein kinase [Planctomycetota bacterium]|nr:MAG: serine/threonine protein kinase [Planctomycetota bacterium]